VEEGEWRFGAAQAFFPEQASAQRQAAESYCSRHSEQLYRPPYNRNQFFLWLRSAAAGIE
jgi:hypothetical protein